VVLLGLAPWRVSGPAEGEAALQPAIVRQPQQRALPDGSRVELRDGAQLTVAFEPGVRRVELAAGEAHFSVAPDPARPFIVRAGGVDVRAVGTAFSVQVAPARVAVLVTEGRVAVNASAETAAAPLALLEAGKQAVVAAGFGGAPAAEVSTVPASDMAVQLAWRVPRLEFSGTRLDEAVALFNRHSATRLTLGDADLARLQISGIVRADNPEALLELLATSFEVSARPVGGGEILLERRR
jgi:transmembrane sensor